MSEITIAKGLGGKLKNSSIMRNSDLFKDKPDLFREFRKLKHNGDQKLARIQNPTFGRGQYSGRGAGEAMETNRKRINNLRPWMFYQKVLGFNYRMTDIHAALGISQLKRLSKFVKKRNAIAKIYNKSLTSLPLKLPTVLKHNKSSFHLYVVQVKKNVQKISRDYLYKKLKKFKINTNIHYIPVYKHPYFKNLKLNKNKFLENNKYFKNAISLPIYPSMKKKQIQKIINSLKKIFKY